MASEVFVRGMLFLFLAVVGIPGNATVIVAFLLLLYQEKRLLAADAILLHLTCVNLLVVGVRALTETLASFRLADIFGDTGCKSVIFIYRATRGLSIWLTFLLSTYQCLSIAPPGSSWASVRALLGHYLAFVFLFLWVLNACMTTAAILFSISAKNETSPIENGLNVQFCYLNFPSKLSKDANGAIQVVRDIVPMAVMTLASLIILVFLYKHSQQVKGLRSSGGGGAGNSGAEQRAAKAVLALMTLYVVFYGADNGLWVYTLTVKKTMSSSLITDLRLFFSSLYAALSPLVIIASNRKVNSRLGCVAHEKSAVEKIKNLSSM